MRHRTHGRIRRPYAARAHPATARPALLAARRPATRHPSPAAHALAVPPHLATPSPLATPPLLGMHLPPPEAHVPVRTCHFSWSFTGNGGEQENKMRSNSSFHSTLDC